MRRALAVAGRYALFVAGIGLFFSLVLFSLDSRVVQFAGGERNTATWGPESKGGEEASALRLLPAWFTWDRYSTFWGHRLAGDVDYTIFPQASRFMRSYGSVNDEARVRRARTGSLFWHAALLAVLGGAILGGLLALRRRREAARGDYPWLDAPAYLPVVALAVVTMLAMARGMETAVDWRPILTVDLWGQWDTLIYPALVLAVPALPVTARFWMEPSPTGAPGGSPAWLLFRGREGSRAFGGMMLAMLAWLPVVEVAFGYPGIIEWMIRGLGDFRVAQAGLQTVVSLGLIGFALGGRPALPVRFPVPASGGQISAAPAPAGPYAAAPSIGGSWLRGLFEHDGFVASGYFAALVAGVLVFAGFFPGMEPANVDALQPLQPVSPDYPMGTDAVGRNIWRLMVEGNRVYLPLAGAVAVAAIPAAWGLGLLLARGGRIAGALRGMWGVLGVLPGMWWAVALVLVSGRGLFWMALGVFIFCLPILHGLVLDSGRCAGGPIRAPRSWRERMVFWVAVAFMAAAANFLVLTHMAFLGIGTIYPGPEVGTLLRHMFSHLDLDWVKVAGPALMVTALSLGLFLPGRIVLSQLRRTHP